MKDGCDKSEGNKICFIFDSYFCEWKGRDLDSLKDKTISIEESYMVPNKWITKIYEAYKMLGNTIYMFGDPNQCKPVEAGSQIHYEYLRSKTVDEICPNRETLQYIKDSSRYDEKTHNTLATFQRT